MNKVILEMELPVDCSDKEQVASVLIEQTKNLVRIWRDILVSFKDKGVTVPTLMVRGVTIKKEVNDELKNFRKILLDHLLKYQPNVAIPSQVRVLGELYALDSDANHWLTAFEESRAEWPLTTWHTVKYRLSKVEKAEPEFGRKELTEPEIEEIRNRFKDYVV